MKKKVIILFLTLSGITACQEDNGLVPKSQVTAINPADLPLNSQVYIDDNFKGEVVTEAFRVSGSDRLVTYEAFMSNNTNLVFHEESDLIGFGNINSRMEMEVEMFNGGMQYMDMHGDGNSGMQNGGMMGNGNNGMMGSINGGNMDNGYGGMMGKGFHEFRNHPETMPVEIDLNELPSTILDYLNKNHPDKEILKAFEVAWEDGAVEFHVLIQDIGGLLFDEAGDFVDMIRRGNGHCEDYEEIAIEDLAENVLEYIESNYPDDKIVRAKLGSHDDIEEIYVLLDNSGVLIFDADGNFLEIMERRMSHHG